MKDAEIYLYGQILMTNSLLLRDGMPPRDGYGELKARYHVIGGETGVGAAVLASLGCTVRMEGTWMGRNTRDGVFDYFRDKPVDLSLITYDDTFDGLEDFVLIDGDARTCLGTFGAFQGPEGYRWNHPAAENLLGCKAAGIDPFFEEPAEEAARLCVKAGLPYVTIDCSPDSYLAKHAAMIALSGEYLRGQYPDAAREDVLTRYLQETDGLVMLTSGSGTIRYGRKGGPVKTRRAFRVQAESTLGAGDTFKAGCIYALLNGMDDDETVNFAAACAAAAVMKFPIPLYPPTLERIADVRASENKNDVLPTAVL
ncbi:MAG: PfkB family carbohydrate kinase [Eubacteriales bacterium]|nr:PfkB family carbohydrate kinase [Eubacteriales bacterium]